MANALLVIGGVLNLVFGAYHVWLSRAIRASASLLPIDRGFLQIFNLGTTILVLFFAYVSFFHRRELVDTALGRTTLVFVFAFFLVRLVAQLLFLGFWLPIVAGCAVTAALYLVPLFLRREPVRTP
ncbi:MAG: hypothetical protein JW819_13240 [Candidatus Krumholzibacteriota bacterium]|nr:hypothetical protein [Candidatus Krumholzibacteriota bacterium]